VLRWSVCSTDLAPICEFSIRPYTNSLVPFYQGTGTDTFDMSRPITRASQDSGHGSARFFGTSYRSQYGEQSVAAIAEQSIATDIADMKNDNAESAIEDGDADLDVPVIHEVQFGSHSMAGNFRRPSVMTAGPRPFFGAQQPESIIPYEQERDAAIEEERSLLRDNKLIPPKHPRQRSDSQASYTSHRSRRTRMSIPGFSIPRRGVSYVGEEMVDADGNPIEPSETTSLLPNGNGHADHHDPSAPYGGEDDPENIDKKWEEAVVEGKIHTTWQRETKVLSKYSAPLIIAFLLQISLTTTSIFTVGHIGKIELGAVSLGGMTANITGYAIYHGLATSLDTLCSQAYGCGKKQLVGLQLQRAVFFLWAVTIPIAIVWAAGTEILAKIIPEREIAELAGQYLRILILGAPGYAAFESGKRYVQAQGRFAAILYVLLIAAPLNILMHWLFVWVSSSSSSSQSHPVSHKDFPN
jgi:multidrug resistance protein, MATE family